MSDVTRHGTLTGYNTDRCRCDECREAYRDYRRRNADRIKARMAQYYLDNRERINERNLAYYYANREDQIAKAVERGRRNPDARRAASARWREKNPGYSYALVNPERKRETDRRHSASAKRKQTMAAWRDANRDKLATYSRTWRQRNPERAAVVRTSVRAKRSAAPVLVVTKKDWARLLDRYRHSCAYCGTGGPMTVDHVVPLSRGGRHAVGNILPACGPCNYQKNARFIVEWRRLI